VADRDVWRLNLELLPPQPSRTWAGTEKRRRNFILIYQSAIAYTSQRSVNKINQKEK